jgi:hypothetical protein
MMNKHYLIKQKHKRSGVQGDDDASVEPSKALALVGARKEIYC